MLTDNLLGPHYMWFEILLLNQGFTQCYQKKDDIKNFLKYKKMVLLYIIYINNKAY